MLLRVSGTYDLQASFGYNLLQENEIYLECDTTLAPVVINLPLISDFDGVLNMKVYVTDYGNNAFNNNISIVPASGNTINSFASVIIDNNEGSASVSIASYDKWIAYDSHTTSPIGTAYNTIQDEGVPLPQRTVIDFVGDSVTASDVGGETKVTVQAYNTVQDEGSPVTQRSAINFVGDGVTVSDNGGVTEVDIPTQQAYNTVEDEGVALPQRPILNFVGIGVTATDDAPNNRTNVSVNGYGYGSFYDSLTQTALVTTPTAMQFNTTVPTETNGVSIVNDSFGKPTLITVAESGTYNIQFSAQTYRTSGGTTEQIYIWLRKNGLNVPYSATRITFANNNEYAVASWNFFASLLGGQNVQIMWAVTDVRIQLSALGGILVPIVPEVPSVILTVTRL